MKKTIAILTVLTFVTFGFTTMQDPIVNNNLEIQLIDAAGNELIHVIPKQGAKPGSRNVPLDKFLKAEYTVVFRDKANPSAGDFEPLNFKMVITPPGQKPYQYEVDGNRINPLYLKGIEKGYKVSIVGVKVKGADGKTYISYAGYTLNLV